MYEPIAMSRREANKIKKSEPITVVIGNPPYKEKAEGRGGWIEKGSGGKLVAPLDRWRPPPEWGVGAHGKHLKNLYVYFWRWATWKVFGSGNYAATGNPDKDEEGIVCFITVAGFLNGPGFQKMRDDLRRTCSEIWVIDCSPEGHQPEVPTRIFQGVQQPVCIVLAARKLRKSDEKPARVRFHALPKGRREEKFAALAKLSLTVPIGPIVRPAGATRSCPQRPAHGRRFRRSKDLFIYDGSGVMPGRTWIIAPDAESLKARWSRLDCEKNPRRRNCCFIRTFETASRATSMFKRRFQKVWPVTKQRLEAVIDGEEARHRADALWVSIVRPTMDHSGRAADQSAKPNALEGIFASAGLSDGT